MKVRGHCNGHGARRRLWIALRPGVCVALCTGMLAAPPAGTQEPEGAAAPQPEAPQALAPAVPEEVSASAEPEPDHAAQLYTLKCAGCHTVGGGALSGPDLKPTQTWPRDNLVPAIQRMEKNVGPLKPEEVEQLTDFLLAADAAARLVEERKRISLQQAAKLEPASAAIGEALFFGRQPLTNGGLSCASCHAVAGRGGNLASDLTGSFAKLGEVPLGSTIENATFPLMQVAYANGPVSKQETVHLVKYLETVSKEPPAAVRVPPIHGIGTVGAAAIIALMGVSYRGRNRGVRARLVQAATRRTS
ncbi:MAG: hypothetical protein AMXMBFR4_01200 [Candidatus Hydrogenedentota bacterium]